jgi:hypothetical protein
MTGIAPDDVEFAERLHAMPIGAADRHVGGQQFNARRMVQGEVQQPFGMAAQPEAATLVGIRVVAQFGDGLGSVDGSAWASQSCHARTPAGHCATRTTSAPSGSRESSGGDKELHARSRVRCDGARRQSGVCPSAPVSAGPPGRCPARDQA